MPYTLRFESNPFRADQKIGKLLNSLVSLERTVQNAFGAKITEFSGNRLQKYNGLSVNTFNRAMDWAEADLQQQLTERKWAEDWPNITFRRNGEIVFGGPRDIVDIGGLMQSQKRTNLGVRAVEFEWTGGEGRDYAEYVHDGYTSKGGNRMPARPWTNATVQGLPEVIQSIINETLK